ncbi:uncharacterized protein TrAtP1_004625 [Trichoderma atroviride]|nr:hypothetical protein TrAtP1_004625 [Trichoderma atroviride]
MQRPFLLFRCRPFIPPLSSQPSSRFSRPLYRSLSHSTPPITSKMAAATEMRFKNPAIFVCDMQEKFRNAIYEFDSIVTTTVKLLTYAQNLSIPVYATTQTSAKLGATVPAIADMLGVSEVHDKTKFSMVVPSIAASLAPGSRIALVGIETHICITQTALDLRDAGHFPYVIADGVSSCNKGEVGIALDRLRSEPGIAVTSSESWMYECLGDASHPLFKGLFTVVKGKLSETSKVLSVLPPSKI